MIETQLLHTLEEILEACRQPISDIKPSEWAEEHRILTSEESSSFTGPFRYERSPYTREIVDSFHWSHPAKVISVMKGAQIGFSMGVIENLIGWIIAENPGPTMLLTGHSDLSEEALEKIDRMIDNSGIRHLIRPTINRRKNQKTGDTNTKKDFPGGSLIAGSAGNHKLLRQRSIRTILIDDFEAAKASDKKSGSTRKMIEQRAAAHASKRKICYISTPELKATSNIEPVFLMGDQRRYHIPCPHCGELVHLVWSVDIPGTDGKEKAGIYYKLDDQNKLIPDSVGYICQKCSGFFKEKHKYETLPIGQWLPTAAPFSPDYTSYHISSLYAGAGMFNWTYYVYQYLEANPVGAPQDKDLQQTFVNLCLGETYEDSGEAPDATQLQLHNIRSYAVGEIPESLSMRDGNGRIILLTCAADINGTIEDARLDYEIVGWSETGSRYSITHGSIGTFIPRENTLKYKEDRERFSYYHNVPNSVWPLFDAEVTRIFQTDTGRPMRVFYTGIDTGYLDKQAWEYIDNWPHAAKRQFVCGLKGDKEDSYVRSGIDVPIFKLGKERADLYIVQGPVIKDDLAELMKLKWDKTTSPNQPAGFMNFPEPSSGKYQLANFFSHYQSEHRVVEKKGERIVGTKWEKKSSASQNHLWDCAVYNTALRDIVVYELAKYLKVPNARWTWKDYAEWVMASFK